MSRGIYWNKARGIPGGGWSRMKNETEPSYFETRNESVLDKFLDLVNDKRGKTCLGKEGAFNVPNLTRWKAAAGNQPGGPGERELIIMITKHCILLAEDDRDEVFL